MKFTTKDLTFTAIIVVLLVVGGYLLYNLSLAFIVPGSKFIFMATYLSLVVYFPLKRLAGIGYLTLISVIFSIILIPFSPLMAVAIILTGILTDLTFWFLDHIFSKEKSLVMSASAYAFYSFATSVYVTNEISGQMLYDILSFKLFFGIGVFILSLGYIGAKTGQMIYKRIISKK